MNCKTIKSSKP